MPSPLGDLRYLARTGNERFGRNYLTTWVGQQGERALSCTAEECGLFKCRQRLGSFELKIADHRIEQTREKPSTRG